MMKNATRALILSGLFFPGMGHIALRRYIRGVAILAMTTAGMVTAIVLAVRQAFGVLDQVLAEDNPINLGKLWDIAYQATVSSPNLLLKFSICLILVCWIAGTLDAYRIGKKMDKTGTTDPS